MTDDDHDTTAESTEQASPSGTGLPPAEHVEISDEWSTDDTVEAQPAPMRLRVRLGLIAVVVVFAGVAFVNPAATFFRSASLKHAAAGAKPGTNSAVNRPAAAPTAATSGGPTATPTPDFSAFDQNFLSLMSQEGWGCGENSNAEQCKKQIVSFAHQICSYSGQSIDVIYQNFDPPALLGPGEKRMAIVNAEQSYPNCTFTRSP